MDASVNLYLQNAPEWREELTALRRLVLRCELKEEVKWRIPVYTIDGGNVVSLAALKECCVLSFFKGVLLNDPRKILEKPGENSRISRVIRFRSVQRIIELESTLESYIREAVEHEKAGTHVDLSDSPDVSYPEELETQFEQVPALRTAFEALTPGRQRGYLLHFSGAKQSKTRMARIESSMQRIFDGKGLHDCICGLSQKMPGCDGSHKHT